MSVVRTCMFIFVFLVNFHLTVAKPFGGFIWCELFCDDDYDVSISSTSTSTEDFDYYDVCGGCPTRRPSTRRPNPNFPPLNFQIPPNTGMGVQVTNQNGAWFMNLSPFGPSGSTPPPGTLTSAAPAAAATTPAATTPAATGAETGGTTVAPTTAKK